MRHIDDSFFKQCREAGVLSTVFDAAVCDTSGVSVDGILDFIYGTTRVGRECADRDLEGFSFLDKTIFRRVLEVIRN